MLVYNKQLFFNMHIMTMKAFYLCLEFTMSDFEFSF